ncbi:hypothetical protein R1sor_009992 [Riccia sorocarpa]|uniref:30S ribosomal protein 3, chloroplastic n=1 Tax=Riccia sorocarpa TaxID=122646 RepID=A0ABD3HYD9_9MARC
MASTTVCCATSSVISSLAGCSTTGTVRSSPTSSISFSRGCALRGASLRVRDLEPRASVSDFEKAFRRLSVKAEDGAEAEAVKPEAPAPKKKSRVSVKPRRQRVSLRFLWLEKNIGIALDQAVPGHGTIPLSPYFFWPRKDAWEELKAKLDSKKWISRKRTIILLNQATDIINLWQQNASNSL